MNDIASRFRRLPRGLAITVAVVAVLVLGVADYATGADVAFALLYLGPIALATWIAGRKAGVMVAVACAVTWLAADFYARIPRMFPGILVWNFFVEAAVFFCFALLLAALLARLDAEQQAARIDPLTHLANRRSFLEAANVELERARRFGHPLTIAYLDIDNFKDVNDRLGHREGDHLLCAVAASLRSTVRVFDLTARMGGDEFVLLLPGLENDAAETFIERIRSGVVEAIRERWTATLSCGAVTFSTPPEDVEEMIEESDRLMYEVKNAGKASLRHRTTDGWGGELAAAPRQRR